MTTRLRWFDVDAAASVVQRSVYRADIIGINSPTSPQHTFPWEDRGLLADRSPINDGHLLQSSVVYRRPSAAVGERLLR